MYDELLAKTVSRDLYDAVSVENKKNIAEVSRLKTELV